MADDGTGSSEATAEPSPTAEADAETTADAESTLDRESTVPVGEDEQAAFHLGTVASGREMTEDDIDEVVYGERQC